MARRKGSLGTPEKPPAHAEEMMGSKLQDAISTVYAHMIAHACPQWQTTTARRAGRQADTGTEVGRQAQAGRQAGGDRRVGRQAGKQAGMQCMLRCGQPTC